MEDDGKVWAKQEREKERPNQNVGTEKEMNPLIRENFIKQIRTIKRRNKIKVLLRIVVIIMAILLSILIGYSLGTL